MQKIKSTYHEFRKKPAFTGFILFIAIIILNAAIQGPAKFFTINNINTLFYNNMPFLLVTMAQAVLLISGTLDVSIGIQLALVNVVTIMTVQEWEIPFLLGCVLGICAAMVASLLCWLCVSVFRLPALLASYSLTFLIRGVNVIIMNIPQGKVERVYWKTYQSALFGFLPTAVIVLAVVLLIWYFFSRRRFGTYIYAVGANPRNAFAAGISPTKVQLQAFLIKGLITGIAGICLTLMTASGNPIQAEDYGIRSLSAGIIGGLGFGGWGSMACGVFGGGFLILIQNTVYHFFVLLSRMITGFSVSTYWQNFVSDIIIFLGLLMTMVTAKGQREALQVNVKKSEQVKRREKDVSK